MDEYCKKARELQNKNIESNINEIIGLYWLSVVENEDLHAVEQLYLLNADYPDKITKEMHEKLMSIVTRKTTLTQATVITLLLAAFWIGVVFLIGYFLYFLFA